MKEIKVVRHIKRKKRFRIEAMLVKEKDCEGILDSAWKEIGEWSLKD